jgi:pSer/pThr/pTyr-binding forkhead associated (FHA) protein
METLLAVLLAVVIMLLAVMLVVQLRVAARLRWSDDRADEAARPPLPGLVEPLKDAARGEPYEMSLYGSVLRVEMGDEPGQMYRLRQQGSTWIGRDNSVNDIVLPASSVSRRHSRIEADGRHFYVHDTGSTNGTFVNGQRISTSMLRHGDTITIGNIVLRFLAGPEEGSPSH